MARAYRFSDMAELADFLRLHDPPTMKDGHYRLYRVRRGDRRELLLLGLPAPKGLKRLLFKAAAGEIEIEESAAGLSEKRGRARLDLDVEERHVARSPIELVAPRAWRGEPAELPSLVLRLAEPEDLASLARSALRLRCDRLRFASFEDQVLLRIERCPRLLLRAALEDYAERVRVYWPQAPGVFSLWGQHHPLAAAWSAYAESQSCWLFFDGAAPVAVDPVRWRDLYEAAEPRLEHQPTLAAPLSSGDRSLRFEVPVFSVKRDPPSPSELWLLEMEERPRLERLVASMSAEELGAVMISVQREASGRELIFLRPRSSAGARDFGGRRFARFLGFRGLYLPVDRGLEPRLRRDQYRALFALKGSELVVYDPQRGPRGRVLRLEANSFRGLERLVDHILAADRERLERVAAEAVFDLGRYARAARLAPAAAPEVAPAQARSEPEAEEAPASSEPDSPAPAPPPAPATKQREAEPLEIDESREAELERLLIREGPSLERWGELCRLKSAAGKPGEAASCAVEALWLAPSVEAAEWRGAFVEAARTCGEPELLAAAAALEGPRGDAASWLERVGPSLRDESGRLRKKLRWLSWSAIISCSRDERRLARVRGAILDELDQFGLALHDIPAFLQARIARERWTDGEAGGRDEQEAAARALVRITAALLRGADLPLRRCARAILGRSFARIGEAERAQEQREAFGRPRGPAVVQAAGQLFILDLCRQLSAPAPDRVRRGYEAVYGALGGDERGAIDELAASLEQRESAESPGAFLASLDRRSLFPKGETLVAEAYQERAASLEESSRGVELKGLARAATGALRFLREELAAGQGMRGLAWLLERVAVAAGARNWEGRWPDLERELRSLAHGLKARRSDDRFYRAVARVTAARVILEIEGAGAAEKALSQAVGGDTLMGLGSLDLMDLLKNVVVPSIEELDLDRRESALERAAVALSRQVDEDRSSFELGSFALIGLRLIDQLATASFSKDQLALRLFRRYRDRDEWSLRDRVLSEDLLA